MTKVYDNATDLITFARSSSGTALRRVGYGDELVTNGDFATGDLTGWNIIGSDATHSVTYSSGGLRYQSDTTSPVLYFEQNGILEIGKLYQITVETTAYTSGSLKTDNFTSQKVVSAGLGTVTFTGIASSATLTILRNSTNVDITIDNISVKEVFLDRPTDDLVLFDHPDDIPRIEYGSDGSLKGLLIEEQRTNLLLNSDNPDTQAATLPAGSHTLSFVGGPSVTGIDDTITANAVDVFIYDTSKDNDGGAWRTGSLAQASSWYNETLNTSTRGSRREFPAVAVIVAESNKVTIYDGDDPALPMWMVFNESNFDNLIFGFNSLSAKNGILCSGNNEGNVNYAGLMVVRFITDDLIGVRRSTYPNSHNSILGVVNRNSAWPQAGSRGLITSGGGLVSALVNDVAMTVLPDAPTDPATGLPVPTIAVATDGGVSVIKDDGTVVDIHDGSSVTGWIDFTDNGEIFFNEGSAANAVNSYVGAIPSADVTSSLGSHFQRYKFTEAPYLSPVQSLDGAIAADGNLVYRRNAVAAIAGPGLCILAPLPTNPTGGLVAGVTSTYNTGWMNGDIKLAALADTTAETLSGSELVVDGSGNWVGDFDVAADASAWTLNSGGTSSFTVSGGEAYLDRGDPAQSGSASVYKVLTTTPGKTYLFSLEKTAHVCEVDVGTGFADGSYYNGSLDGNDILTTFTAQGSTTYITIRNNQTPAVAQLDNISVRLADPDRSVNGKGLGVHGSITKAPVATGADVVAYSGFSASNYLEQPYNSDLDFGTGDFCVMGWVNLSSTGYGGIAHLSSEKTATSNNGFSLFYTPTLLLGYVSGNTQQAQASRPQTGSWEHVCFLRRNGTLYLFQNGNQTSSAANNRSASPTDTTANLLVGGYYQNFVAAASNDKFALLRISGTAPTADQIAKIYEDEKLLFQENAKATLTGTSDAVTALAHDPDTNLLHVGTSGGRSVFYGLRRVNETATAVTTAISAVDGLIVEQ